MAARLGWTASLAGAAAAWSAAAVAAVAGSAQGGARFADAVVVSAYCLVGAVVLAARPGHVVGRLLVVGGVTWGVAGLVLELLVARLTVDGGPPAAVAAAVVFFLLRGIGFAVLLGVLPLVFPDGTLPSPAWRRPVRWLLVALAVTFVPGSLLVAGNPDERLAALPNPLHPPGWAFATDLLFVTGLLLLAVTVVTGLVGVAVRWRRAGPLVRQQLGWFAAALATTVLLGVGIAAGAQQAGVWSAAAAPVPVAIGVAVLQHRLYDVGLLVNRTLRYGLLSAAVVAIYVLVVTGVGGMLGVRGSPWVAAGAAAVVAVAFAPLRDAFQRGVNRLTYGAWDEPYRVLDRLGDRLAASTRPGTALADALADLAESLRLRHVAVLDREGAAVAEHGTASADDVTVPLVHRAEPVGSLVASPPPRRGGERLLGALAHQLAPAVAAAALTRDLQRSRERLVASREEERRRLRRDLHDGVGTALAALSLRVDTARNTVGADPAVDAVLLELRGGVQEVVGDVRRVLEDLRPPALEELGLAGAVRRLADRFAGTSTGIEVTIGELPALPAAVEVAAYRVVAEAVTNVLRHAGARCCRVSLVAADGVLHVHVADDGAGTGAGGAGHGLVTMRERAEEVGGTFAVSSARPGTVVAATLPVGMAP